MKQTQIYIILGILALLFIGLFLAIPKEPELSEPNIAACTKEAKICPDGSAVGRTGTICAFATCPSLAATSTPDMPKVVAYGDVMLFAGETANFPDVALTLLRVTEDSRCATDVTCIWAGTLKAEFQLVTPQMKSTSTIELNKSITVGGFVVSLTGVAPYPKSLTQITPDAYRLTMKVEKVGSTNPKPTATSTAPKPTQAGCYVGGCSGEICSDKPDIVSTCMYREEYACYRSATCARQTSGACGWTETPALKACLMNPTQAQ